ncbi:MAG: hypothetical protein KDB22_29110 [Planctomycetales bacterium]|nr:hypothetical protein [Planctomycetales bacterium]
MANEVGSAPRSTYPRNALELSLARIWEQLLQVDRVGIHDNFFDLGGDSITAMSLLARIVAETGHPLPGGGLLQAPTIAQLAATIARGFDPASWSPMVPIQKRGTARPLFCVHPGGGSVLCYLGLSQCLGEDQPFYALQAPGVDGILEPLTSVVEMAETYVAAIREVQPHGPYNIAGWSAGGVIAYEIAQQLLAAGEQVSHLGIIDSGVLYTLGILRAVSPDDQPGAFEMMGKCPADQIKVFRKRSARAKLIPDEADDEMAIQIMQLFQSNVQAIVSYRPEPFLGRVDIYQAEEALVRPKRQPFAEWQEFCTDIRLHSVPGNHLTMIHAPHVSGLATAMKEALTSSQV